jgi:putative peptide zinc metalloprotease protein
MQTVAAILTRLAQRAGGQTFSENEALEVLQWLRQNDLLAVASNVTNKHQNELKLWKSALWLNPLLLRIPLARPDRFFAWLATKTRILLGPLGFVIWLAVLIWGAGAIALNWESFAHDFVGVIWQYNGALLLAVWLVIKILHEISHGVFCRHFGAGVREVGVFWILFFPISYVDATPSLALASKWRRAMVALAGIYMDLFVAACAAIVWASTDTGIVRTIAHQAVIAGTIVSLFFNANPLMRFDGYYVLSELLDIPNLATRGRERIARLGIWLLSGSPAVRPEWPRDKREWVITIYGLASWLWQFIVVAGLLVTASVLLRGGGLILAFIAAILWLAPPLVRAARRLPRSAGLQPKTAWTFAIRLFAVIGLVAAALFVPFKRPVSSTGVVEWADTRVVRADCPGFIENIYVADDDFVQAGQLLIDLRNDEAVSELAAARDALNEQVLRARTAYARTEVGAYQAEQARVSAFETAYNDQRRYVSTLQVRASQAGRVANRQLSNSQGKFFRTGDELLRLGKPNGYDIKIAVSQSQEPHFRTALQKAVKAHIVGRAKTYDGRLVRVEAKASREIYHPALTAMAGGPVAVRQTEVPDKRSDSHELAEAHFMATAHIEASDALQPGEIARLTFWSDQRVTLWQETQNLISRWIGGLVERRNS